MPLARAAAALLAALIAAPSAALAAGAFSGLPLVQALDDGRLCDRLAAFAPDPDSTEASVPGPFFDAARAREACTDAVLAHPEERRYRFQLARAHWRLGDPDTAFALLESSADAGSPGAYFVLGRLYHHGEHVPRNHTLALMHYLEAYRLGAPAGLAAAQAIYSDPESPAYDAQRAEYARENGASFAARFRSRADW